MNPPIHATPPSNLELARRLLAAEAACASSGEPGGAATRACDRMRASLAKLVGPAGFQSLLSRALAVARLKCPALRSVEVRADGSLSGFEAVAAADASEAGAALMAELLGLLMTFIGETLALQIVRDAWPEAGAADEDRRDGGRP